MKAENGDCPLNICLLSYRSNPHCGGQGVYIRQLSKALKQLGHNVHIVSGPPEPVGFDGIPVSYFPGLDLYNPDQLFRIPSLRELSRPVNLYEWLSVSSMGFPEPATFGIRAYSFLRKRLENFDIVHDNQCLSYGIWALSRKIPLVATIHHPISVDRDIAVKSVSSPFLKMKEMRWYSFIGMQKRVARTLGNLVTVSRYTRKHISKEFNIPVNRLHVAPNGIDTSLFTPLSGIERRPNRIMVTNSADTPLKGLAFLLRAVSIVARSREVELVIVGKPGENGRVKKMIEELGIKDRVRFTGRIEQSEFSRQYARAAMAVVPSVYEGFGLPAAEAMACGVPVISTTGGALAEIVGEAGVLAPPENAEALAAGIRLLIDNPEYAKNLGRFGMTRVRELYNWKTAAEKTVAVYRKAIRDYRELRQAESESRRPHT